MFDVDHVEFAWDLASGPVAGYYVLAIRNGSDHELVAAGPANQASVSGQAGDEIQVVVAAYDAAGQIGPASPYSPTVRFNVTPDPDPTPTPDPDPTPTPDPDPTPTPPVGHADLDFNGDGTADFLLRDPSGMLTILYMDGSSVQSTAALKGLSTDWAIVDNGDYDGNGKADIVWHRVGTSEVVVWLLDNGQIQGIVTPRVSAAPSAEAWEVGGSGDLDGDGDDELLLFSSVLGASEVFDLAPDGNASNIRLAGYVGDWGVDDLGDYDGDGFAEVMWRDHRRHDIAYWDLDATGTEALRYVSNSVKGWHMVGSGDFDGNGTDDLFMTRSSPDKVEVWLLEGDAFVGIVQLPLQEGAEWIARSVGDHDRDGLTDLSWSNETKGELEIWFSNGGGITIVQVAGQFADLLSGGATIVSGTEGSRDSEYRRRLCDGDFNDDGVVDGFDVSMFTSDLASGTDSGVGSDMNSDGLVTEDDVNLLAVASERGTICVQ